MSSAAAPAQFPDFQFSVEGSESSRKKVDFKSCSEPSDCNWRNSLAWDTAFFTSPGILELDELFETLNLGSGVDCDKGKKKSLAEEHDMRRSLAWDSAFLNSAGVLDAEELSIVNRGFRSSDAKPFTAESNSMANSDGSSSLASLEIDLFSDIKGAFNQKLAAFSSGMRKEMVLQQGNDGSSSGKPPRMSIQGTSAPSTTGCKIAYSVMGSNHGGRKGKTRTLKSTPTSKSLSSAVSRNGSSEFDTRTPPFHSRRAVDLCLASSVPSSRTPLKYLAGSKNGSASSIYRSSSLSSTPKVFPASSISELSFSSEPSSRSSNHQHNVSPVCLPVDASSRASESKVLSCRSASPRQSSTAPQMTKRSVGGSTAFSAATSVSRKMQASGLKMPSPKLGFFDPEKHSGSTPRRGHLRSSSRGQLKTATETTDSPSRTSLGKHQLAGNLYFCLNNGRTSSSNERWEDSFTSNNNMKKKKRCLKEDEEHSKVAGTREGRGNCSCTKRPENNKENSIAVATSLDSHLKPVRFSRGFSPVWK